ncbi:MAG: hypothetical protein II781_01090 [Clostridia bacterium]|nr:hypothetical protein [Clostridia bacterium]
MQAIRTFYSRYQKECGILLLALVSRIVMCLLGYIQIVVTTQESHSFFYWLYYGWESADSPHYLYLARFGYQALGDQQNLIVFYPLYPLCIRLFSYLCFGSYEAASLLVSYVSFLAACLFLYKLVRLDGTDTTARTAVWYLILFPFAFFFQTCMTESLFALLCVLTFYFMRKEKFLFAGICGFLAALCRTQGILLFAPVLYEILLAQKAKGWKREGNVFLGRIVSAFLIPAGFAVYLLINRVMFGDFFAYLGFQEAAPWYQSATMFWKSLVTQVHNIIAYDNYLDICIYIPQILLFFISLGICYAGLKNKVRTSYVGFAFLYLLVTYSASWMLSGDAFSIPISPSFSARLLSRNACFASG